MNKSSYIKLSKQLLTQLGFILLQITCLSQVSLETKLLDSVSINIKDVTGNQGVEKGYSAKIFDSILFIFINESNDFYQLNLYSLKIKKKSLSRISEKDKYNVYDYYLSENRITTINYSSSKIRQYDWDGLVKGEIKPKTYFSKYHIKPFSNIIYDNFRGLFYLPIATTFREKFIINKPKKAKKYYNRDGLIGVFDSNGKLIEKIGKYDSIYLLDFYTHSDRYYYDLSPNNQLILSQQLSHKIHLINPQDVNNKVLELKGEFIDLSIQDIPISNSIIKEEVKHNIITSFNYGKVSSANKDGLIFRYYKISHRDTTTSISDTTTLDERDLAVCKAPTRRELNQEKILNSKKLYVQLFDLNTEMVYYDGIFPFKGDYIYSNRYSKKDEMWTGKLTLEEIKLYRYRIVK